MRGFSKVVLAGNLTRDPEVRTTPSGNQVCSFAIAINRRYKSANGEWQESTSFIDCNAWNRTGETIHQYLHKGSPILISGRLEQHSWDDKTTGQRRSRVEVVVDDFNFIGSGGSGSDRPSPSDIPLGEPVAPATPAAPAPAKDNTEGEPEIDLAEIPF